MALAAAYKQFLSAPTPSQLAADATLNYVTTTTSFKGSDDIIKHIGASNRQLKKKKEEFISVVEGQNAIAADVDTAIEFLASGGAYLPSLDDNFLIDRVVYLPVIHVVTFDGDGKIVQIRQSWDQGSLLKQLDVIGKTGRNWPIRDSTDQIKMIQHCVKLPPAPASTLESKQLPVRSRENSTNSRGPQASSALFGSRDESDHSIASVISPRGGARPRQRDFTEILGDEPAGLPAYSSVVSPRGGARPRQRDFAEVFGDEPVPDSPSAGRERSESPSKTIAPKFGAGKNYRPSRLFEIDEQEHKPNSPTEAQATDRRMRPHPTKYNHFDIADGTDPQDAPVPMQSTPQKTKHTSQWDFGDFYTPAKPQMSKTMRQQEVRHWSTGDDEIQETPAHKKPAPAKPRRDAETHFELMDDGVPQGEPRVARPRGTTSNNEMGLYKNHVQNQDETGETVEDQQKPLGAITNTNLKDRGRDFGAHWEMADDPSVDQPSTKGPVSDDRMKAVKMMEAHWSSYDESPQQKENKPEIASKASRTGDDRGIHIAGDGMGGGKGSNRDWLFGEDNSQSATKSVPGRKQGAKSGGFSWDF